MTPETTWNIPSARTAGALYLAIALCGGFSIGYVPTQIVADNGATTAAKLLNHQTLFQLGVLADCAIILFELAISVILFDLFRAVGPKMALVALISRFGMIGVMAINLILWVMPQVLLTSQISVAPDMVHALIQYSFNAHAMGVFVWQLFFGVHLLALGWLILNATIVPHLLGWGLAVGALGYLIQGVVELTFTDIALVDAGIIGLLVIVTLSEIGLALWLLLRGGRASS